MLEKMQKEPKAWVKNAYGSNTTSEKLFSTYYVARTVPTQISHLILWQLSEINIVILSLSR